MYYLELQIVASLLIGAAIFLVVYNNFAALVRFANGRREAYLSEISDTFESLFEKHDVRRFAMVHIIATLGLPIVILFTLENLFLAFIVLVFFALYPRFYFFRKRKARNERLEMQILDGLSFIANALKAGLTLPQAFDNIARQMPAPISEEFGLMMQEYRLGVTLDEALTNMLDRIRSANLNIFVSSIMIARQSGGNVADVLEKMTASMKEIARLEGKIDALTAQGRAQALVLSLLPLFLGVTLYYLEPSMIMPLLTTTVGYAVCLLIGIFWGIGVFFVWKIVNIEV
ncbi:type II secretion system F family protein [bacterium]|nr:type II secretion system F family protein [bacterium]MCB9475298.1 type II secretion system F family protein [Deltaproteobacteria bacterium]